MWLESRRPALLTPTPAASAFLAGYTDGEAWIGVGPANGGASWQARIVFAQTRPEVVRWIYSLYGGSLLQKLPPRRHPTWRPQLVLTISSYGVIACFLQDVLPYLREKRALAQTVLDRFASNMPSVTGVRLVTDLAVLREATFDAAAVPKTSTYSCGSLGCTSRGRVRGLCLKHYYQAYYAGTLPPHQPRVRGREASIEERAYSAGFFDGEGCLQVEYTNKYWRGSILFAQTRAEGVRLLHEIYGGTLHVRPARGRRKQALQLHLAAREDVFRFLREVQPYSIEKREQIARVLGAFAHGPPTLEAGRVLKAELTRLKKRGL